ncbi:hypothetical protein [Bradyrhizobium sp. STM 3809]|uniref:hypothetical protein n=1 Tax=Bradyrhizobium sp. STM 3809 TaxID=551936 RepID=UPI0002406582|nr:hypothetical protein [Bradyrhizobium sp. STM 3809]CCD98749.1 conserved exported hypothetical protein [Bradyrhizobium sp. STM 3809]
MSKHRPSIVRTLLIALCLAVAVAAPARSEDEASHIKKFETSEFDGIDFKGQSEFEIHDPDLLPKQLVRAIAQTNCRYKEDLKALPVRFLVIETRRFALVPCFGIAVTWHEIFDLQDRRRPRLLQLTKMAPERGFVAADSAGFVTWNKDDEVFEATGGNDMCTGAVRHIYKLAPDGEALSLIRVDFRLDNCGAGAWKTLWTAPPWPTREQLQ